MGPNLLFGSVVYLLIFVNAVISGRFPLGLNRMRYDDVYGDDDVSVTKTGVLDWSDENENDDGGFEHSREEASWERNINGGDEEDTAYITDVQINEIRNTQEKLRHQDQEAYQVDPRCPKFDGFCNAQICTSDNDCGEKICCYNGCVHSCLENQASVNDLNWIPYGSQDNTSFLSRGMADAETITIPGGCKVSQKQRTSLELFYKYGHVTKCACIKEDIVCYVRKRETFSSSNNDVLQFV